MAESPSKAPNPNWVNLPGPGSYSPPTDQRGGNYLGDAPSYSMGARKAVPKADAASPGPVYSPRLLTPMSHGPMGDAAQYSFGNSKRFMTALSGDPGPGQYPQVSTRVGGSLLGDAPKYGFGTSLQREPNDPTKKGKRFISKVRHAARHDQPAVS